MVKIKRTWVKLNRDERLVFANLINASLTGNANVPTPNPTLVNFAAGSRQHVGASQVSREVS